MTRGDIVAVAGGAGYAGKPRPAVIVQSDAFRDTASVTVALLTSDEIDAPLLRLPIEPDEGNRLRTRSWVMADKLVTVRRDRLGKRIGRLADTDMLRLSRTLVVFLGLAG